MTDGMRPERHEQPIKMSKWADTAHKRFTNLSVELTEQMETM